MLPGFLKWIKQMLMTDLSVIHALILVALQLHQHILYFENHVMDSVSQRQ